VQAGPDHHNRWEHIIDIDHAAADDLDFAVHNYFNHARRDLDDYFNYVRAIHDAARRVLDDHRGDDHDSGGGDLRRAIDEYVIFCCTVDRYAPSADRSSYAARVHAAARAAARDR